MHSQTQAETLPSAIHPPSFLCGCCSSPFELQLPLICFIALLLFVVSHTHSMSIFNNTRVRGDRIDARMRMGVRW